MRTIKTEFPRYPKLDVTLPAGFVDDCWINETCPGFFNAELSLRLWIDYPNPEDREDDGWQRFTLIHEIEYGHEDNQTLCHTDNWQEILDAIEQFKSKQ